MSETGADPQTTDEMPDGLKEVLDQLDSSIHYAESTIAQIDRKARDMQRDREMFERSLIALRASREGLLNPPVDKDPSESGRARRRTKAEISRIYDAMEEALASIVEPTMDDLVKHVVGAGVGDDSKRDRETIRRRLRLLVSQGRVEQVTRDSWRLLDGLPDAPPEQS